MWKNAVPLRCTRCRARVSVPVKRAGHAAACNSPRAWSTGELSACCGEPLRIDTYRLKREHRRAACHCHAYPFVHRKRSGCCMHRVTGTLPGDPWADRPFEDWPADPESRLGNFP